MKELSEFQKQAIRSFVDELPVFGDFVSKSLSIRISSGEILMALVEETREELQDLALKNWNQEAVLKTVENSKYIKRIPVIEETIELNKTIIPSGTYRAIYEEQVKFEGEQWVVHKNDADPFPSSPHAHNYESGLKMHLGTGELYYGKNMAGKLRKKNFLRFRKLFKRVKLPSVEK
jgi:hypothetical protein